MFHHICHQGTHRSTRTAFCNWNDFFQRIKQTGDFKWLQQGMVLTRTGFTASSEPWSEQDSVERCQEQEPTIGGLCTTIVFSGWSESMDTQLRLSSFQPWEKCHLGIQFTTKKFPYLKVLTDVHPFTTETRPTLAMDIVRKHIAPWMVYYLMRNACFVSL